MGLLAGSALAGTPCTIDWQRGILTVNAQQTARAGCLEALAQRTGLKVSGLEHVHGAVTLALSTPLIGELVRQLAGDASYTLVENDADHAGNPRTQSVRFAGVGTDTGSRPAGDIMRNEHAAVALVENLDLGVMEAQPPRPAVKSGGARDTNARPDAVNDVQVHLED